MRLTSLSVATPAYNEHECIEPVLTGWFDYLSGRFPVGSYEVVVCDDGSIDGTAEILLRLQSRFPALRVVTHPSNRGAAVAMASAIRATTLGWVLLLDVDGQFPIQNLDRLEAAWTDPDVAAFTGARSMKSDTAFARLGSWGSGQFCNLVHGTRYRDFNSAFKLVRGHLLRGLPLEARGLNYSIEITSRLLERGVRLQEVEIEHRPRLAGRSSMHPLRGALDRALFVSYLGSRRLMLRMGVLRAPGADEVSP